MCFTTPITHPQSPSPDGIIVTEFELIARLTEGVPREARDLGVGVGDDACVIAGPAGRDWLLTADALIEGIHFRREWTDLAQLGRKALAVNLSDIAAMGGRPRFFLATVAIPRGMGAAGAIELSGGMRALAAEMGVLLVGGDTSSSEHDLAISITAVGEVASGRAILRSTARTGDVLYATGTMGGSALGLACLRAGKYPAAAAPFVERHRNPLPRLAMAEQLAACGMVSAMIDVSDGLLADAGHVAESSGAGFEIEAARVPRDPAFEAVAREVGADPTALCLAGGEDYELLFAVRAEALEAFERDVLPLLPAPGAARIGRIVADRTMRRALDREGRTIELASQGFDHFTSVGA
jgi:thiamine-monophosphate kinase